MKTDPVLQEPTIPEPTFFLKDELIYFLQKNSKLTVEALQTTPEAFTLLSEFSICDKRICNYATTINLNHVMVDIKNKIQTITDPIRADVGNLVHHLLEQQKRIEALEAHLSQYTTKT